ncbi:hypothetical protein IE81DRAFT_332248 [Ceraceosorus guamensis]|uniref:Uncharacterized protein n=1 Tax=Ceraceosorus guamensis TaxID=1522189 RepID=A0A316VPR4_9BASI|nr:hypothetical protein IE81DRAFT_332248 [Ceraceosorus guamensis]PWN39567.1 hypothetical protein IE81DRAFT_332248 [Ceraceosorus guamensis]
MKLRIIIGSLPLPPLLLLLLLLATLALSSAPTLAAPAASAKASEADRLHAQQQEKRDLSILRGLIPVTRFPGTNLLAASYPNEITVRYNGTVVIIPTSKSVAQSLLPANEKLLPTHPVPGLAADQWPIVLQFGLSQDIKQYNSGVGDFYTSRICVPWTDRSADGKTPFSFHVVNVLNLTPLGLPGAFFSGEQVKAGLYNPSNQALGIRAGSAGTIGSTVVQASILKEPLFDFKLTPISQQDDGLGLSVFSDFAQQGYTNSKSDTCTYCELRSRSPQL